MCYEHLNERGLDVVVRGGDEALQRAAADARPAEAGAGGELARKPSAGLTQSPVEGGGATTAAATKPELSRKKSAADILLPLAASGSSGDDIGGDGEAATGSDLKEQFAGVKVRDRSPGFEWSLYPL